MAQDFTEDVWRVQVWGVSIDTFLQTACGRWQIIDLHRSWKATTPAKVLKCLEKQAHHHHWLTRSPAISQLLTLHPTDQTDDGVSSSILIKFRVQFHQSKMYIQTCYSPVGKLELFWNESFQNLRHTLFSLTLKFCSSCLFTDLPLPTGRERIQLHH